MSDRAVQFQVRDRLVHDVTRLHIVVSPAPVAGFFIVDLAQRAKITAAELTAGIVGETGDILAEHESWGARPEALQRLLDALTINPNDPVIVLSGDVHYAYSEILPHTVSGRTYPVVQLCSSSSKNTDPLTQALSLTDLLMTYAMDVKTPDGEAPDVLQDEEFLDSLAGLLPDPAWWKANWPKLLRDAAEEAAELAWNPQWVLSIGHDLILESLAAMPAAASPPPVLAAVLAYRLTQRLLTAGDAISTLRREPLTTKQDQRRAARWTSSPGLPVDDVAPETAGRVRTRPSRPTGGPCSIS
jgi:hypothetical protein